MKSNISPQRLEVRLLMTALVVVSLPLFAALASAQENRSRAYTDPAAIDRAVAEFTGAGIGELGGARMPADKRLRLTACASPLTTDWHGRAKSIVKVECQGPESWRIFIATKPAEPEAQAAKVVVRGDPITVLVRGRGFSVQQNAEAIEGGAIGDWIAVRTVERGDAIRARIERPGLAVIPVG
ncbi:flagella basal body P-ring formation protein FlgA [Erythrobacter sp. SCSIO 43205]|uniref:flagella basal body P-ring formation protein FlgA n=1 Tax=Erythrobacter sp. SCSIO 43205 TaxID=2779361 RepID=UPI001CA8A67C|nr:flagella basal body P-ring formation protein FlgA [Erythrobacter sp. SCSIO 43205]UAB78717.1 flagella basal body P-ring formation protein FlgA [Erythrobacter sp. SCSIO 43205]